MAVQAIEQLLLGGHGPERVEGGHPDEFLSRGQLAELPIVEPDVHVVVAASGASVEHLKLLRYGEHGERDARRVAHPVQLAQEVLGDSALALRRADERGTRRNSPFCGAAM